MTICLAEGPHVSRGLLRHFRGWENMGMRFWMARSCRPFGHGYSEIRKLIMEIRKLGDKKCAYTFNIKKR